MIPWIWFWAPRIQYPYSGALSQWVQPNTSWFFDAIPPQAGIGEIEKKIFDVASYGRQLGLITEILLESKGDSKVTEADATKALARLSEIHGEIERVKAMSKKQVADAASDLLRKMLESDPERLKLLLAQMQVDVEALEDKRNAAAS